MVGAVIYCIVCMAVAATAYWCWTMYVRKRRGMVMILSVYEDQVEPVVKPGRAASLSLSYLTTVLIMSVCLGVCYRHVQNDTKIVVAVIIVACVVISNQRMKERRSPSRAAVLRQISYELPLVMERIVMAVQAGHDILPALKIVLHHGEDYGLKTEKQSWVLKSISDAVDATEAGMTLQSSLRIASQKTDSTPLRHALLHIAVAHEQGGGLLFALSELADATQSYYQESVEEQIATLPVKATLPLVVVFGGLLIILLTSPIIQILDTTASYGTMK